MQQIGLFVGIFILFCILVMLFDFLSAIWERIENKLKIRDKKFLNKMFEVQLEQDASDSVMDTMFNAKVTKLRFFVEFMSFVKKYKEAGDERIDLFLENKRDIINKIATEFRDEHSYKKAYVAYALGVCELRSSAVSSFLMSCARDESLNCSSSALRSLCALGDENDIISYLDILDMRELPLQRRVIVMSLLSFSGESDILCSALWNRYPRWSMNTKAAVIDFFGRVKYDKCAQELISSAYKESMNAEQRIAIARYFGSVNSERADSMLREFLENDKVYGWEMSVVSALSLANYKSEETFLALKRGLSSHNWYVRQNCAISLKRMGYTKDSIDDVISGGDRYAADAVRYAFEIQGA